MQTTGANTEPMLVSPEPTCTDTVFAAKSGDDEAFTQLCKRSSQSVLLTILRITKHQEDAEDALQDATLRAFRHLDNFDGRSSFTTWFTRIGINSQLQFFCHRSRLRGRAQHSPTMSHRKNQCRTISAALRILSAMPAFRSLS